MSQRDPRIVLGVGYLLLLALVAAFVWWVHSDRPEPEPCAQPAIVYIVTTATPTPIPAGPVLPTRTPVPPLVLPEQLPRETATLRPTSTLTVVPSATPTPAETWPAVQRG